MESYPCKVSDNFCDLCVMMHSDLVHSTFIILYSPVAYLALLLGIEVVCNVTADKNSAAKTSFVNVSLYPGAGFSVGCVIRSRISG